jgi:tetratricopeptide (TPR) repeat protein
MKISQRCLTALSAALILAIGARADEIIRTSGDRRGPVEIRQATHDEVQFKEPRIPQTQRLRGDEVWDLEFSAAKGIQAGRSLVRQGRYEEAIAAFGKVIADPLYSDAALFGAASAYYWWYDETGDQAKAEAAIKQLEAYLEEWKPKKGFYVPRALYLLGKAALAANMQGPAAKAFDELAGFTGESRRVLSQLGKGQLALAKGDAADASRQFNTAMNVAKRGDMALLERMARALRGRALVAEKRYADVILELEDRYLKTLKGEKVVFDRYVAQAYNALGDAYAGKGGTDNEWEALYRYLWTTVIFRTWRAETAEAFSKAAALARKLGATADADRLRGILTSEYGNTAWASKSQ